MNLFNSPNFKHVNVLKIAGFAAVVIIVLAFVVRMLGASFSSFMPKQMGMGEEIGMTSPAFDAYGGASGSTYAPSMPALSVRNIAPMPPASQGSVGGDAEAFEVTRYNGTIETRHLAETCGKILTLKSYEYVVFEQANDSEHQCHYTFKVERAHTEEILAQIKELQPKELSENIQTVKGRLDDFTSEKEILEKKLVSIEKTLGDAIQSYEEIAVIATRSQDAASLAKIIDSKLQIIERLTQERLAINEQLDRLERAKTEQLDQVTYTHFSLSVYETVFVDGQVLKDSWKAAIKEFVYDINLVLQDVTVRLVSFLFFAAQYVLYFFILLFAAKYVWRMANYLWKKC